jgi:hypothetical protein
MLSLSISYPDLVKFHYFVDTTEKRGLGMKGEAPFFLRFCWKAQVRVRVRV